MGDIVPQPIGDDQTPMTIFNALGHDIRFGVTSDDRIYAIATDLAKAMGYRDANKITRLLEGDEAGTQIVSTRSVTSVVQRREVSVIYEDGIWELIFRSSLPGAKAIKKRVKAILREIRQTGRYEADQRARGYEIMAGEGVDFSVRDAATILNRDHQIITGQNTLFAYMRACRMLDRKNRPYAKHKQHLVRRMGVEYLDQHGETKIGGSQVRVTAEGMAYLHRALVASVV